MTVFLALLAAHLFGDFLLQTHTQVVGKRERRVGAYGTHGLAHFLCAEILVLLFVPAVLARPASHALLLLLILVHLALDYVKEAHCEVDPKREWAYFLADQVAHVVVVAMTAAWLARGSPTALLVALRQGMIDHADQILGIAVVYLAVVFGGGYLIRFVLASTEPLAGGEEPDVASSSLSADPVKRERLGMYIGWLERTLVTTALLAGAPGLVGLVIAAKAVIRFRENAPHFAEYFLLGTFLSLVIAGAGGLILRQWLFGGFAFVE